MIDRTEALVLQVTPFSNTSLVVQWLTATRGKLATLIKGACRPRSAFLGQVDQFYTCDVLFYRRAHGGLHILRECTPIRYRLGFRSDWRAAAAASWVCELASRASDHGHPQPEAYGLATAALDALAAGGAAAPLLFWFELRLLCLLGLAPRLDRCAGCNRRAEGAGALAFSCSRGGVLCPGCAPRAGPAAEAGAQGAEDRPPEGPAEPAPVSADVAAILRRWQAAPLPRTASNSRCTRRQTGEIRDVLGRFLLYHLDVNQAPRRIALEIAGMPPQARPGGIAREDP